jgi:galactokinase
VEVLFGRIYDNLFAGGGKSAVEIAQIGQKAENLYFGKPCGLMDQTACASGGAVAIDFRDAEQPLVRQVDVDLERAGFVLCVVNTRGSHAGLTPDYAAIPAEMKAIAAHFGKDVLRETDENEVLARAGELRNIAGDRALLRAMHFFNENRRVDAMLDALERLGTAYSPGARDAALASYLALINESGDSSWELLQNVYTPRRSGEQGVSLALALTRNFLGGGAGACRVHGGGFAGTIQSCIPLDALERYRERMDGVFGAGSVTPLRIRPIGAEELRL